MKVFRDILGVKTQIHDIEIDSQTELRQSISGEDLVSSRFTIEGEKIDIQIGDYIEFKDSVYTILDEPQVKKEQNAFTYLIEFKSDQYILKNVMLINPDTDETEFFLYGNAIDMISLIIHNMNRVYTTGGAYYADYVEQTGYKNMGFQNENCLAAIQKIASEYGCEFSVKGKKITFREKIGSETGLTFRYKKELEAIERQSLPNGELMTVLMPFGAERNITNEYGSKRLKIAPIENNTEIFGTIERAVVFDDIYPRLNGSVSTSSSITVITDTSIDFDLNEHLMGGIKAKVIFNTGDLAGREFEISRYTHSTKTVEIIPFTDDSDLTLPNEILKPRVGDKYVFVGIKMPQAYIDNAEAELLERATEYLEKFSQPNVIYKVKPHYPALRSANLDLNLGDIITLSDADFGIDFQTRILSIRQKLASPFQYEIDLGNQVTVSYFTQVMTDQKNLRNNVYLNQKYVTEQFNRIFNNVRDFNQAVYVNRGEFNPDFYYYNNQNRIDYVFRLNIDGEKEWYVFIGQDHSRAEWIEANWRFIGDNFDIIATQVILAENANIGDWIIQNGQIVSQAEYNGDPRVHLNGSEGYIKLVSPISVYAGNVLRDYSQTIMIDSRTGTITFSREGDVYQEPAKTSISSNGVLAEFAGIDVETPPGFGVFQDDIGKAAVFGDGTGNLAAEYENYGFVAGVAGRAINTAPNGTPAYGGAFFGLKSWGRYVGVTRIPSNMTSAFNCGEFEELVSCYNTSEIRVNLPKNPVDGRRIEVRTVNAGVRVYSTDKQILRKNVEGSIYIIQGDTYQFIYDGLYWLANKIQY